MKVVILAGGLGTRLSEETGRRPKPMVEIGGRPILWHIMKTYAHFGFEEFVIALGYKGEAIKQYFLDYYHLNSDLCVSLDNGDVAVRSGGREPWKVHLIDTGLQTQTGGRIKRLEPILRDETFMLTYGDGVADIDIEKLVEFHRREGRLATLTAVRPSARFGGVELANSKVARFEEKPRIQHGWINGGFFVLEPEVLENIDGDDTAWERAPLERLTAQGQLSAYLHDSFWQCMDTLRDVRMLEELWSGGNAPWKIWS
jgi:glucose-1-phosphate cytidylyltransferase